MLSTVTQQVSADLRTFRSNISSKRGQEDVTLWTLYQALKLLERQCHSEPKVKPGLE